MKYTKPGKIFEKDTIDSVLEKISDAVTAEFNHSMDDLVLIGIQRRGVPFARRLSENIERRKGIRIPVGTLDIGMYRDDIGMRSNLPPIQETRIPFDLNGKTVILADDVLQAGRSIRAALDAINDFGRPSIIRLAVLFDRGNHEFPIAADYVGMKIEIPDGFKISVHWTEIDGSDFVKILEKTTYGVK